MEGLPSVDYADPVYLRIKEILESRLKDKIRKLINKPESEAERLRGAILEIEWFLKEPPADTHTAQ